MNRRPVWIACLLLILLLGFGAMWFFSSITAKSKVTVSFVNSEHSYGPPPVTRECERLAFTVRNAGARPVYLDITETVNEDGTRIQVPQILGKVNAAQSDQLYLYLPRGSQPKTVCVRVCEDATVLQKAGFAIKLLIDRSAGRYPGRQLWFDRLQAPVTEFTVKTKTGPRIGGASLAR